MGKQYPHPLLYLCFLSLFLIPFLACTEIPSSEKQDETKQEEKSDATQENVPEKIPPGGCKNGETKKCYTGPSGTEGIGPCKAGTQLCVKHAWSACSNETLPSKEVCDGLDNNCNGEINENLSNCGKCKEHQDCTDPSAPHCIKGACVKRCKQNSDCSREQYCKSEVCVSCSAGSHKEKKEECNGKDDDCDGQIDNDAHQDCFAGNDSQKDKGICRAGKYLCAGGKLDKSTCLGEVKPGKETCNGKDDDCDGYVDNGSDVECFSGAPAEKGKGECKAGVYACLNGKVDRSVCLNEVKATKEVCNGKDDDCDGQTDEDSNEACFTGDALQRKKGECKDGIYRCVGGKLQTTLCIGETLSAKEACDGKDNDCDGLIDEGISQACGSSTGECQQGTQSCNQGKWGTCKGEVKSTKEVCDGKDNDCDGKTDEDFTTLNTACEVGKGECKASGKLVCTSDGSNVECNAKPKASTTEVCDNKDNDCDGNIDEGVERPCGKSEGECKMGTQVCSKGQWGACAGDVPSVKELCDGKDNDCDGKTDEDFTTLNTACEAGKGECKTPGKVICTSDGSGVKCNARPKASSTEVCDNKDNNCDGKIDENLTQACGTTDVGECKKGTQTCSAGKWSACSGNIEPTTEVCGTKDTNCDGKVKSCTAAMTFAGEKNDNVYFVGVDGKDHVYVIGNYISPTLKVGDKTLTSNGSQDIFVAKVDQSANKVIWVKTLGGTGYDSFSEAKIDKDGNLFLRGSFAGAIDIGGTKLTGAGLDLFFAKLTPDGKTIWALALDATSTIHHKRTFFDDKGQIFIVGKYGGTLTAGTQSITVLGNHDLFALKIDAKGKYAWLKSYGSSGWDEIDSASFSSQGNLFIGGNFDATTMKAGAFSLTRKGKKEAFVLKIDGNGNFLWAKSFGGTKEEKFTRVIADNTGACFVTGRFESSTLHMLGSTRSNQGKQNTYVARIESDGKLGWLRSFGGTKETTPNAIFLGKKGYPIILAHSDSPKMTIGKDDLTNAEEKRDAIFVKYDPKDGKERWARTIAGTKSDFASSTVLFDAQNNMYVSGFSDSPTLKAGSKSTTTNGLYDVFVTKIDENGDTQWITSFGGDGSDSSGRMAFDKDGNIVFVGNHRSTSVTYAGKTLAGKGVRDIYLFKVDKNGKPLWAVGNGGTGEDFPQRFAFDSKNNIFFVAIFESPELTVQGKTFKNQGGADTILVKITKDGKAP